MNKIVYFTSLFIIVFIIMLVTKPLSAQVFSESQVVRIMTNANEAEVALAHLALKQATHREVKAFAEKMRAVHEESATKVIDTAKENRIKSSGGSSNSAEAKMIRSQGEYKEKELKPLMANAFDKAYMAAQIEMHQDLLWRLDTNLIPAATNPALKTYLQETRAHVQEHLEEAKRINALLL